MKEIMMKIDIFLNLFQDLIKELQKHNGTMEVIMQYIEDIRDDSEFISGRKS